MIITQTPLRLSFFGGNTDFPAYFLKHGGLVLTATIDKYIYCIVKERFDDKIIVNYSIKEEVDNVADIKHDPVREALKLLNIKKGIEISFLADIPSEGTGLGSSSAVTVGVLNALHAYLGENASSKQLAEEAVRIELDILGNPVGIQDQYAVALGELRAIEFADSGHVFSEKIDMEESLKEDFNNSLMLFYTGISRKSGEVLSSLDVVKEKGNLDQKKIRTLNAIGALISGNLSKFGTLLYRSWEIKKERNPKTTNNQIDIMHEKATTGGILGGKVIGAGGGGFLLVMFPANKRAKVREALKDYKEMPFRFTNSGSRIVFNNVT